MASPASTSSYSCTTPVSSVDLAARHGFGGMHHDADEIVVPGEPALQVQHRQDGLRRDGERDFVGDDEAMRAVELLVAQEFGREAAQVLEVGSRPLGQKGVARQRGLPGSAREWGAARDGCAASGTSAQVDALRAGAGKAKQLGARRDEP